MQFSSQTTTIRHQARRLHTTKQVGGNGTFPATTKLQPICEVGVSMIVATDTFCTVKAYLEVNQKALQLLVEGEEAPIQATFMLASF